MDMQVYIANLGKYNEGELAGRGLHHRLILRMSKSG